MPGEKELQEQQEEKSGPYFAWRSIIPGQRPRPADLSDVCAKKERISQDMHRHQFLCSVGKKYIWKWK